jgi:hypothetical protein
MGTIATRSATTSDGQESRAIRSPIASATPGHPSYLSAARIPLLTGWGTQQSERAART